MQVSIPVDYIEKRLSATALTNVGITAERFLARLSKLVVLVKKYNPAGTVEMNEGDAEMFDLYCEELKAPVARKPRQTKTKAVKSA